MTLFNCSQKGVLLICLGLQMMTENFRLELLVTNSICFGKRR